jgi:5-methylcytosine-specific restriction endonuclease McrA
MANQVFANGMEVSCKAADGKSICAFPDVCFTPPQTPATPPGVPIPYPNTGLASDTSDGSTTVKISGQEVMLKNKSYFKKSTGDEAGCAPKKGLITSTIQGKVYFTMWSMNVMVEGENVVRHFDLTTHNHASPNGNEAIPFPHIARLTPSGTLIDKRCQAGCPRQPTDAQYDAVRKKTPSRSVKKTVNSSSPKKCAACGEVAASLAADHIIPLKVISQMPGFACLSEENQKEISNSPSNFVGLCRSCNSSKCAKLWFRWTGVKSRDLTFKSEVSDAAQKTSGNLLYNLKNAIRGKPCG